MRSCLTRATCHTAIMPAPESVYQIAGHIGMPVLVDANVHPVPQGTDAPTEGSPSSLPPLEISVSSLHFSSEEQRDLGSQASTLLLATVFSLRQKPVTTFRAVAHLAIASPYCFLFSNPLAHIVMAIDGVDSDRDTRYWYSQWSSQRLLLIPNLSPLQAVD